MFERTHGPIGETVEASTGGGGRHLYFAHPGEMLHNRVGLAPGVDLRGDGGYVVAPPSVHPSGTPYGWACPPAVCRLAPLPRLRRLRAFTSREWTVTPDGDSDLVQTGPSVFKRRKQLRPNRTRQRPVTLRVLFQVGHAPGLEGKQRPMRESKDQ
jgi:hypothetical protein